MVDEMEEVEDDAVEDSSFDKAVCALVMSFDDSAESTLERKVPSALEESALDGLSFLTSARCVLAPAVSPDLMEASRLASAESKDLLEEDAVDEVDAVEEVERPV